MMVAGVLGSVRIALRASAYRYGTGYRGYYGNGYYGNGYYGNGYGGYGRGYYGGYGYGSPGGNIGASADICARNGGFRGPTWVPQSGEPSAAVLAGN